MINPVKPDIQFEMEQIIEPVDKTYSNVCICVYCWASYLLHQDFMAQ